MRLVAHRPWRPLLQAEAIPSDFMPWLDLVAPGVVLHDDNQSLQATIALTGPDLRRQPEAVQASAMLQVDNALQQLEWGWSLHSETLRLDLPRPAPVTTWQQPIAAAVAREHESRLFAEPLLESVHFVTLRYTPPSQSVAWLESKIYRTGEERTTHVEGPLWQTYLPAFLAMRAHVASLLRGVMVDVTVLDDQQTWDYLGASLNLAWRHERLPEDTHYLAQQLDETAPREMMPGDRLNIRGRYLRTISLQRLPHLSVALFLASLNDLGIPFSWTERWIPFEDSQAQKRLKELTRTHYFHKKGMLWGVADKYFGQAEGGEDPMAIHGAHQVEDAQVFVGTGQGRLGKVTVSVTVWDEDWQRSEEKIQAVHSALVARGLQMKIESTNVMGAFFGSRPGLVQPNPRKPIVHSVTGTHLLAIDAVYSGPTKNPHWPCGPLFIARTARSNPYRYVPHPAKDAAAHTFFDGPNGCHAKGTMILMADGSLRCVEDIIVGDRVMGSDSLPRLVLDLHRGVAEMVKIIPRKGDPFIVNLDHVLSVKRCNDGSELAGSVANLTVRDWLTRSRTFKNLYKLYRVDVKFSQTCPRLPIPPYVLGVLLGDGALTPNHPSVTKPDPELREAVAAFESTGGFVVHDRSPNSSGCASFSLCNNPTIPLRRSVRMASRWGGMYEADRKVNPIVEALKSLGLYGASAHHKFIPWSYQTASTADRMELLAGLLDTDGSLDKGCYDFVSASQQLVNDITFLVRSLGFAAYPHLCTKSCQNGFSGTYYRISISGDIDRIPCRIPRKRASPRRQRRSVLMTGFSVEPVGAGDYYGFECNGDHLYLMGDFTVCHNSGKSYWKDKLRLACQQVEGMQDIGYDVKGSSMVTTLLLGGRFDDLGKGEVILQPYRSVDIPAQREWALGWTVQWLRDLTVRIDPYTTRIISSALNTLAHLEPSARTISGFMTALSAPTEGRIAKLHKEDEREFKRLDHQRTRIYQAMARLQGTLLDGAHDGLTIQRVHTFELESLMEQGTLVKPVMRVVDHAVTEALDGRPTILWYDEFQAFLDLVETVDVLNYRLRRARDKNVMLLAGTQNNEDLLHHQLGPSFLNNCENFVFFPNPNALSAQNVRTYQAFGLTEREIHALARAIPRRQWLHRSSLGTRLVEHSGGPLEVKVCGRSGPTWHAVAAQVLDAVGRERFTDTWVGLEGARAEDVLHQLDGLVPVGV